MQNNDDFLPETVDEQIGRLAQVQPHQNLNATLIQQLETMCEEDRNMLERVSVRYAARLSAQPSLSARPDSMSNEGTFAMEPARSRLRSVRRRQRIFAVVAALLVATLLVGSALWTINTMRQADGSQPGHTPQMNQTNAPTTPTVTPSTTPSNRVNAQVVYDDAMHKLLLFSGQDYTGSVPLTDTWAWDGSTWTQLHPVHNPGSRVNAAIAYDPDSQQVVLFGGMSNVGGSTILNDTWTWNGSDWKLQHPASSPPARTLANLAYDTATGQLVLFGGKGSTGFAPGLDDTWIWTGSNWVGQHPTTVPPARMQASLAYDGATRNLVLYGGTTLGQTLNDTWIWTGSNWVEQQSQTTPVLSTTFHGQTVTFSLPSMVYDPNREKLMLTLVGQSANDSVQPDYWTQAEWTWNGSEWTEVSATGPMIQNSFLFYDAYQHTIFEFTSFMTRSSTIENALWKWDGQAWVSVEKW